MIFKPFQWKWLDSDGGDDGGRVRWSYRHEQDGGGGSSSSSCPTISSSSGTIVSSSTATYTSRSSAASRLSSVSRGAAAMLLDLEVDGETPEEEEGDAAERVVKDPHKRGPPPVPQAQPTTAAVLQPLQAGLLLMMHGAGSQLSTRSWKPSSVRRPPGRICSQGEEREPPSCCPTTCLQQPCSFQFARFTQAAMSRMLVFVDFIAAVDPKNIIIRVAAKSVPRPYRKINILILVLEALSKALSLIHLFFQSPPSPRVQTIQDELANLLSAKQDKARDAIWTTLEDTRTRILMDSTPQEPSSDIHKLTLSMMFHITFLLDNSAVSAIVHEADILGKYVPETGDDVPPLDSMIMDMASCLRDKLVDISKSFPDQGLGFLFLLNNTNFMTQQLCSTSFFLNAPWYQPSLAKLRAAYMESYMQVSWAPMLSCLSNHPNTPLCFRGNYSPLSKFESEFQKMYTTQRQWKVPHRAEESPAQSYH
ncbi:hypothetical protein BS78_10G261900 [Paspalum vaginatum]|nr:hypothetical protein BS78_10G261900 [Paspalum vaginatum]